jgi:hypothetical protein
MEKRGYPCIPVFTKILKGLCHDIELIIFDVDADVCMEVLKDRCWFLITKCFSEHLLITYKTLMIS